MLCEVPLTPKLVSPQGETSKFAIDGSMCRAAPPSSGAVGDRCKGRRMLGNPLQERTQIPVATQVREETSRYRQEPTGVVPRRRRRRTTKMESTPGSRVQLNTAARKVSPQCWPGRLPRMFFSYSLSSLNFLDVCSSRRELRNASSSKKKS